MEDNLAASRILEQEAISQQATVAAAQHALTISEQSVQGAVTTYLEVITSQNTALTNEAVAVNILGQRMANTLLLIEALGGGWEVSQLFQTAGCTYGGPINNPSTKQILLGEEQAEGQADEVLQNRWHFSNSVARGPDQACKKKGRFRV